MVDMTAPRDMDQRLVQELVRRGVCLDAYDILNVTQFGSPVRSFACVHLDTTSHVVKVAWEHESAH